MKIYQTNNLDKFVLMGGNREISQSHVNKLVASITNNNMLDANPIMVTGDGVVIDGQHRLEAAKQLGVPISYVIVQGDLRVVQALNSNAKQWSISDYVESYIELGRGEYSALKDFKNKWGVGFTMAAALLMGKYNGDGDKAREIRNGTFKIVDVDWANLVMEWVDSFSEYADNVVRRNRSFISAVIVLMESKKITLTKLKHKLTVYAKPLVRYNSRADYMRQIEEIINFKSKSQMRIF